MVDYYRKIERSVTISADKRSTVDLQVDVWSADANITKFILKLDTADSTAIDLTDATVTTALVYDGVILQDNGQVEEVATQRISYVLNERLRGYEGVVNCGFYVTLKTGQKIDIQNVSFNMRKSLIDTDLESARENAYATFDTITNDVKGYANTQKGNIDGIVTDVKNTGNTAKTQIGQALPSVQSKVSAINTELAKIDENMPDLFVAYADDSNGGGFSKTDSSKLYKGYGVKNSNLATDYRWERNSSNLQIGGRNLFIDAGFKKEVRTDNSYDTGYWYSYVSSKFNYQKYDDDCNCLYFTASNDNNIGVMQFFNTNKLIKGETYSVCMRVKVDQATTFRYQLIKKNQNSSYDWYFNYSDTTVTTIGEWVDVKWTFTIPKDDDAMRYGVAIRNLQTGTNIAIRMLKPKLEIGNMYTGFSLAHKDLMLNSNPINSILTTLYAENPSTTLGGTWTQLGTESKFSQTIYYWKRTN